MAALPPSSWHPISGACVNTLCSLQLLNWRHSAGNSRHKVANSRCYFCRYKLLVLPLPHTTPLTMCQGDALKGCNKSARKTVKKVKITHWIRIRGFPKWALVHRKKLWSQFPICSIRERKNIRWKNKSGNIFKQVRIKNAIRNRNILLLFVSVQHFILIFILNLQECLLIQKTC